MVCADLTEQATLRGFNAAIPKLDIREFWKLRELARKLGELGTAFDQGRGQGCGQAERGVLYPID